MKTYSFKWIWGVFAAFLMLTFASCQKSDVQTDDILPNQNKISVYLTDGPGYFDSIFVNIQSVAVKIDTTEQWWGKGNGFGFHNWWHNWGNQDQKDHGAFWDTLQITPGVYNLLDFANGADTLLASSVVPKGRIIAFKLTLGESGNSLSKNGVSYPLKLVPGWNTVFVRVYGENFQSVTNNHYKIWLDFDAGRSVIKVHDGLFYLRPFIRAYAVSNTGAVTGTVKPKDALPVISVFNESDTLYAIPGKNGMYMVKGLPEGTYSVFINPSNSYQDTTITGITVTAGKTTQAGSVTLHK